MDPTIACSLVDTGVKCGSVIYQSEVTGFLQTALVMVLAGLVGMGIGCYGWWIDKRDYNRKLRALNLGWVIGAVEGAKETWTLEPKPKNGREVP